jgi:hypothetical protein
MDLSRLVSGGVAYVTNIPVYLATTTNGLKRGAVVCAGATGDTRGYTLSVTTDTSACKNAIGVLQAEASFCYQTEKEGTNGRYAGSFRIQSNLVADRGALGGNDWLPACINPDALYMAWYSTTQAAATASDTITQSITASTGTLVAVASFIVDKAGGWLFSAVSNSTGAATYSGSLRYIKTNVGTTTCGLITAMNVSTDSSLIYMTPIGLSQSIINSTGQYLRSQGGAGVKVIQGLLTLNNFGVWANAPMHPLRSWVDDGLDGLTNVMLYDEIFIKYCFLNQTTA